MQLNILNNSFLVAKLVHVAFHTWVVWYACIHYAAQRMTLLNVLNRTFTMFFPVLSSTSLILSAFFQPDIHFFTFYETGILIAMVIANTVIQICRSKMFLQGNNVKKMYEIFFISEMESKESFLGPVMIIAFQMLFVMLCFCRKMYTAVPRKSKMEEKNYSPSRVSAKLCIECDENSTEKCDEIENEPKMRDEILSENILNPLENIKENVIDQNINVIRDININNEKDYKDMEEGKENLDDDVGSKKKKKIKLSPSLYHFLNNSSNPSKELDSTNSEINFENDTRFSESDSDADISLGTLRIDNSSNQSVFSVTDCSKFSKELIAGSSSSPRNKCNENAGVGLNENLEISVQFPMDLTPEKSKKVIKVEESSDIKPFETHQSSAAAAPKNKSKNLDCAAPIEIIENEKKYDLMLEEFKLTGDKEIEEKFIRAVIIFEMIYNCNFLEWLFRTTQSPDDISKFIRYVEGRRNKEKVEKHLREWINVIVTSCKNIDIRTNPNRKFHKEIQLAFMKNDEMYKLLRINCKNVLSDIEDLGGSDKFDEKKLTKCYTSLAHIDDDYRFMCLENKEKGEKEKIYVNYLTLENTLGSETKPINTNTGLECGSKEKLGTIFPEKDLNLEKLQEEKFPVTRKDIFALHGLEINPSPFVGNCKIIYEDSSLVQASVEKKEITDFSIHTTENISLEKRAKTGYEENIKSSCEDQEKIPDSKELKLNVTNREKFTQGTKSAYNTKRVSDSVNTNPSSPISINVKDAVDSDSDSEDECNDVIDFFEKIRKSVDEKKSLSAEEVYKKYGRIYYGGDSFLKAKKYIKEKHAKNNKRRKEQEEEIHNTIEDLYAKLNKINPQKSKFQKDLATTRIENNDWDNFY